MSQSKETLKFKIVLSGTFWDKVPAYSVLINSHEYASGTTNTEQLVEFSCDLDEDTEHTLEIRLTNKSDNDTVENEDKTAIIKDMLLNIDSIEIDEENHSFVVRYWTDIVSENSLSVYFDANNNPIMDANGYPSRCRTDYHLTCFNSSNPTDDDIDIMIKRSAPLQFLKLQEIIATQSDNLNLENVNKMVSIFCE